MSEPMTVELIAESEWVLKGYWTKLRAPINKTGDIDVLAYCPHRRHLVVTEVKAQGARNAVFSEKLVSAEGDGYVAPLLKHLRDGSADGRLFGYGPGEVAKLTVQLVSNWVIKGSWRDETDRIVFEAVKKNLPGAAEWDLDIMLDTTLEVFARVIEMERRGSQTKRYGHPILDVAREINRYLRPSVSGVGRSKSERDAIQREGMAPLMRALLLPTAG